MDYAKISIEQQTRVGVSILLPRFGKKVLTFLTRKSFFNHHFVVNPSPLLLKMESKLMNLFT